VRDDLADLDAVEGDEIGSRHVRNGLGARSRSVLGLEDDDARAMLAVAERVQ
jgi:hypothetical protein